MSQLVFIILINLIVLLTVALSLGLFFFLRHRKQHEQAINQLLSGISKQQSGRAEALQEKLGNDSQKAEQHSDMARALAMAENTFYQEFVASLLDRTGKKLTQVPDTVQILLDQYVSTLADRLQNAAGDEATEHNTVDEPAPAESEAADPVLDNSDDIEVTLNLDELDVPETGEVGATESTLDDSDDIEVTLDIDELDEADTAEAGTSEPVPDDADDLEINLDLDALDEPEAAEAGANEPVPDDADDLEINLDLDALDEPEAAEASTSEPVPEDANDLDALDEAEPAEAGTNEPVLDDNDNLEASLQTESTAPDTEQTEDVAAESQATPPSTPDESSSAKDQASEAKEPQDSHHPETADKTEATAYPTDRELGTKPAVSNQAAHSDDDPVSTDEAAHNRDKPTANSAEPKPQEPPDDIQMDVDQTKVAAQTATDK